MKDQLTMKPHDSEAGKGRGSATDTEEPPDGQSTDHEEVETIDLSSETSGSDRNQTRDHHHILADLAALTPPFDLGEIELFLRELARLPETKDALGRVTLREKALETLRGKVSSPAKLVDAALGNPPDTSDSEGSSSKDKTSKGHPYLKTDQGLFLLKSSPQGVEEIRLTNFTARIAGEVIQDDGSETHRLFEIEANVKGRRRRFTITGQQFLSMTWVTEELGPTAVISAGLSARDHTRAAIQLLSGTTIPSRTIYTHLGWQKIDGQWSYLHAAGAIGANGAIAGVQVQVPDDLSRYILPAPPSGDRLIQAIRTSMRILDGLLSDEVSFPVHSAIWRAAAGLCDFALHVVGHTGGGKTMLAILAQQHQGAGLDSGNIPASWSSTANSLEVIAFTAKDALLLVDDSAPDGTVHDVQKQHREMARLLRAQGNRSGRQRLRADGTLQQTKYPRGLILSTGEDVPKGQSIQARILILEVEIGAMNWELLTICQADAASGVYAEAYSGYIQWLASHRREFKKRRNHHLAAARERSADSKAGHRRTTTIEADLILGLDLFLAFAEDAGAVTNDEANRWMDQGIAAIQRACQAQADYQRTADPVPRFLELLRSAIGSQNAHLADKCGDVPKNAKAIGWHRRVSSGDENQYTEWIPKGDRIGWIDGGEIFLDPDASFRVVQRMAPMDGILITSKTLWKRMRERKMLASTDEKRSRNTVRKTLSGSRREVLHLKRQTLLPQETAEET